MNRIPLFLMFLILFQGYSGQAQKSWHEISQPGQMLCIADQTTSYCFFNETIGSHGSKYTLKKSDDSCHTFSLIKTKTGEFGCYSLEEMFFLDADTGFFSEVCQGAATIYKTYDGGASWTGTGMGGSYGISMFFLRADYGFHSFYPGEPNDSYLMRNASPVFITKEYKFTHNHYNYPGQKTEIFFKNDSTGLIMCRDSSENAVIIKSEDYGNSWTEKLSMSGTSLNDMIFISGDIGFVVGSDGKILKTDDFGESWNPITLTITEELNAIDFSDDGIGYIAGNFGSILKSDDMGESWTSTDFINTNDLVYIRVFDEENVFVLNINGQLYSNQGGSSVDEYWKTQVRIFPNPVKEILQIEMLEKFEVTIYDMHGQKLLTSDKNKLDLSSFSQGIYILEIATDKGILRKKIIKQ